jgi:hypothetical protein
MHVRYEDPKMDGGYRYTKDNRFDVEESDRAYSKITITLPTVAGGNHPVKPSSKPEWDHAAP